ncbi:hypothetical protein KUTeg_005321 [Tegillarca granosa]|uniref:Uncharacterized protein n=1 Tax=Tegillarca granosa TaxID=220873 RepID=A0ABQ9FLB9_TEGGR|nr:hypothetical protein KUTeg_005321 [Tegillarca granosa]
MSRKEGQQSLRSILQEMGENSTIHGIPRIVGSRHKSVRIIWLCLFLSITGFLIFQLTKLFAAYYSWPMKTSVSLEFSQLQFPAISFCNMNPIKKSINFTKFQTSEYGNCYTIESDKFTTRRTGSLYGLWLTLNLESDEYMTNFADAYGIKLIIHEPGTFPFPAEEGITINPNFETTIGLRMASTTWFI